MRSVITGLIESSTFFEKDELFALAERLVEQSGNASSWALTPSDTWLYCRPTDSSRPMQGWKLHISATVLSAMDVTSAVLPILIRNRVEFKMVRSRRLVAFLNEAHSPRPSSGKFITIYPATDEEAVRLAAACHEATNGLKGPAILSDRRFCADSLVHYRYGGFVRQNIIDRDGRLTYGIRAPNGELVPDLRSAWFSPPPWTTDPFRPDRANETPVEAPTSIWLQGRYRIAEAIRHANKGGVYIAQDEQLNRTVIIKEARPYVAMDRFGRDATERLRVEAANLRALAERRVAPQCFDLFEEGGHLFLVLEHLAGVTLRQRRAKVEGPWSDAELLAVADSLAALLQSCHDARMLIRDFNPNNVIVTQDDGLRVIDLEMSCIEGETRPIGLNGFTPGYTSPQQMRGETPTFSDDYYSLAATLFFLLAGGDPPLVKERPQARSLPERIRERLERMERGRFLCDSLGAPVLHGLSAEATERWSPERVRRHLHQSGTVPGDKNHDRASAGASVHYGSSESIAGIVRDLLRFALASIHTDDPVEAVASSCAGSQFDPCNVQYGAAGVGMFLLRMASVADDDVKGKVSALADWVWRAITNMPTRSPGLYFGAAGAAWFLLEAAKYLADDQLHQGAGELILSVDAFPDRVDISHGASGIGLTLLHFYSRTGDKRYLERAIPLADKIIGGANAFGRGIIWPQPGLASDRRIAFYGFAHGNAGIAYFLLAMFWATGDERYAEASGRAAETLIEQARLEDNRAYWSHGPDRPIYWTYWCNGSSGVGTMLLRLYRTTHDPRYLKLVDAAAEAVHQRRWFSSLGQCHGLAGNGEFLLDAAALLGNEKYSEMARDLVEVILCHRVHQDGAILFPDDTGAFVSPDYGVGTSGIGVFLHRFISGGHRLFMVDELSEASHSAITSSSRHSSLELSYAGAPR